MQQGRLDEAKHRLQDVLAQDPKSVEGYNLLGIVCISQKDYDGASDALQHALRLNPASSRTKNNLGNLYVAQQKLDLAEQEFRDVLRTSPTNADANYNLGLVLLATNKPSEAIPHLQRISPPTTPSQLNLMRAYLGAGRVTQALKIASDLSARKPKNVQLHFMLGSLLASEKQ